MSAKKSIDVPKNVHYCNEILLYPIPAREKAPVEALGKDQFLYICLKSVGGGSDPVVVEKAYDFFRLKDVRLDCILSRKGEPVFRLYPARGKDCLIYDSESREIYSAKKK